MARGSKEIFGTEAAAFFMGDLVNDLVARVEEAVAEPSRLEPDEYDGVAVPCIVAILANLHELSGAAIPEPSAIANWKAKYMEVWDAYTKKHGFHPWPERRSALQAAFNKLQRLSKRMHS